MKNSYSIATLVVFLAFSFFGNARAGADIIAPEEDVMTSAFFSGPNFVRGYQAGNRPTFRVGSNNAFGVGPETIYLKFSSADFSTYSDPVDSAILTMESVSGGFGADASSSSPFVVSANAVNLDPFANITDDTNTSGTVAWRDFFNNNILDSDEAARTTITGSGTVQFDVTGIVNDWIEGNNAEFFIAMTGKDDSSGNSFLHGFRNNSNDGNSNLGVTFLTVSPSAVPEPGSCLVLLSLGGLAFAVRRRRS